MFGKKRAGGRGGGLCSWQHFPLSLIVIGFSVISLNSKQFVKGGFHEPIYVYVTWLKCLVLITYCFKLFMYKDSILKSTLICTFFFLSKDQFGFDPLIPICMPNMCIEILRTHSRVDLANLFFISLKWLGSYNC